jgi:nitric oxide reductase activation protein
MCEALSDSCQAVYERLVPIALPLARQYREMAGVMQHTLTAAEMARWSQYCLHLAQCGWRTWESAEVFLTLSPFLAQQLSATALWEWAEAGMELARRSVDVATAFFQAAKPLLRQTSQAVFASWVAGGAWFLQQYPTRPSLASEYFRVSALVYGRYPLPVSTLWRDLGQAVTQRDVKHGQAFFHHSRMALEADDIDLAPAWKVAQYIVPRAPEVALQYLERYADFVHRLGPQNIECIQAILLALLSAGAAPARAFLRLVGGTFSFLPATERAQALEWCQHIATSSPTGMLEFLQHFAELSRRLPGQRLQSWVTTGIEVARRQAEAGQAYFALESAAAQDRLHTLQKLVTFTDIGRVLQLYTEGLLGRHLELRTTTALPSQLHASGRVLPTTDGAAIFVPEQVDDFATASENFAVYKVAVLHQAGFYECGTFTFMLEELQCRAPDIMPRLATLGGTRRTASTTAFEDFFAAFAHSELARGLFAILEDARIDAYLARRYKGIRHDLHRIMQHSLQHRPALQGLTLRQALLEGLLQVTLGGEVPSGLSPVLRLLLARLVRRVQPLLDVGATVYDTAIAVVDCYCCIVAVPLRAASAFPESLAAEVAAFAADFPDDADAMLLADMFRQAGEGADTMPALPESTEPAQGIEPVPYRGEMKPELIQKQFRLQELTDTLQQMQDAVSPIPPEVLKELLEQGRLEITSVQEGDVSATSGLFVNDLEGRKPPESDGVVRAELQREIEALRAELHAAYGELAAQERAVLYDEWDYLIGDYRKRWCCLTETILPAEDTTFVAETRQKYAELLTRVLRQFQLLKPDMFKKIKRLVDGEDIDLDSAIEALVDRRAGNILSDKVYMRRHKRDRSVAALFLLDMSASTDDEVKAADDTDAPDTAAHPPPRPYDFSGFIRDDYYAPPPPPPPAQKPRRRIIDVEKEALILMAEALEALGDHYAIYGFSGYGRDQVDFFVAKEFTERYDACVQGRIAAIKPHRSTRMGPAIRHAIRKLERQEARMKTLLLLSDGYPQDYDYGKDRKSKEYGIQDTMMALHEARLKGIQTFCITVDPAGHDYLRAMCPDHKYLVIEDIAALPKELPKIYRGLTT